VPTIRPLILSGGSGTRLWPLSTRRLPKQFVDLLGGHSLFEMTLERHAADEAPIIVAASSHAALVEDACAAAGVEPHLLILEPTGRNTAPASVAGALAADPDDVLVVLPSDHLISRAEALRSTVAEAAAHAEGGSIVVFGVDPRRPETGFGYIEVGDPISGGWEVAAFKEKPAIEDAERMLEQGRHLWNSGIFVLTASTLLDEIAKTGPSILARVEGAMAPAEDGRIVLGPEFEQVESISFDHAVMEKTGRAVVLPLDAGWDDIGSFHALWTALPRDEAGNAVEGDVELSQVTGSLVKATSRRVAVAGVDDLVVIETPDAVLVVPRERSQLVRDLAGDDG
jgi:mannose-1-phosphate guanylyltransferase/mannose-6-phosphate isomerase